MYLIAIVGTLLGIVLGFILGQISRKNEYPRTYISGPINEGGLAAVREEFDAEEGPRLYACDAAKNEACPKTACYIHGGPCGQTTKPEYRKETKNLTKDIIIWWVNHLFNMAKEQAFNARQLKDALEIQDAQFEIVKTLRDAEQKAEEEQETKND